MPGSLTNEQIIHLESALDKADSLYPQVKLVWAAMQDWPSALENTDELIDALHGEMGGEPTKGSLEKYARELLENLGREGNGWRSEAVAELLELFEFYPGRTVLTEIMDHFGEMAHEKLKQS